MVMIKVVCGIIYKSDKIFICRRKPKKSLSGYWEFPGGKIESDEKIKDCLERELKEELNMTVKIFDYFESSKYNYDNFSIDLIAYKCSLISWNNELTDHDKFAWVHPDEILNYKLAAADIPLAKKLNFK